jgi:hypothetical protein
MLNNIQEARDALNEMPPREDEELDSVTLHNLALVNIEKDPDDSFKKLNFLLKVKYQINDRILLVHLKLWLIYLFFIANMNNMILHMMYFLKTKN